MVLGHFRRPRLGLIRFTPEKQDCRGMLPWKVNTRIRRMEHKRAGGKGKPLDGTPYHRHGLREASPFEKGVWFPLALEMQGYCSLIPLWWDPRGLHAVPEHPVKKGAGIQQVLESRVSPVNQRYTQV